tara:strand:- start:23864 stop:24226 length:363 start_codon:yes stop_codon:yes gene_type:complete
MNPMKKCNVCGKQRKNKHYKYEDKKTCLKCEKRWWVRILRLMVADRRLSPLERISNRLAYFGTAFIVMSPYLLKTGNIGAITYLIGALCSLPQVWLAKQWNIVVLHVNLIIGYGLYLITI